ncbi:MAG: nucleoside triphosphate pyrophosphohydrolase [Chloroflexota bacterium]|nr:nucleoside triphosphate pyrophosphohydrolase [Chloroflexota bacterium]
MTSPMKLTIVGLGPGDSSLLTLEAREALASAGEVWLRTARHPTVSGLPSGPRYESFDDAYEAGRSFDDVYEAIVGRVLELATRPQGVLYAVPGHPLVGEATVRALVERGPPLGIAVRIVAGLSFLDVLAPALGLDPLADGLLMLDALSLVGKTHRLVPGRPTVIAQVYDQRAASQVKLALLDLYPPDHAVRVVSGAGTAELRVDNVPLRLLDRSGRFDHLTSLFVPPLPASEDVRSFAGLRGVVARLRAPVGGCPWDLEQTHDTLKRFLLEEAYEALDALDEGQPHRIEEELGDLLMQVVLHAQVAEDAEEFAIEDVLASITGKLIRRHPHVFGTTQVSGPQDVLRNWDELKKAERGDAPLLAAVPKAMPALAQAQSLQARASKAGFDMDARRAAADALERQLGVEGGIEPDAFGDLLFTMVGLAVQHDVDAEESLRMAIRAFREKVSGLEAARNASGQMST